MMCCVLHSCVRTGKAFLLSQKTAAVCPDHLVVTPRVKPGYKASLSVQLGDGVTLVKVTNSRLLRATEVLPSMWCYYEGHSL